jgi:hypothetical protein
VDHASYGDIFEEYNYPKFLPLNMDLPYHIGCDRSVTDSFFLKKKMNRWRDGEMRKWGDQEMGEKRIRDRKIINKIN